MHSTKQQPIRDTSTLDGDTMTGNLGVNGTTVTTAVFAQCKRSDASGNMLEII